MSIMYKVPYFAYSTVFTAVFKTKR